MAWTLRYANHLSPAQLEQAASIPYVWLSDRDRHRAGQRPDAAEPQQAIRELGAMSDNSEPADFAVQAAAIDESVHNRNGPTRLTVPDWWKPEQSLRLNSVWVDRHGRLWSFDDEKCELVMFEDTNAAKF